MVGSELRARSELMGLNPHDCTGVLTLDLRRCAGLPEVGHFFSRVGVAGTNCAIRPVLMTNFLAVVIIT